MMQKKLCFSCGEKKPLDEFHKSHLSKDGRQVKCKDCTSAWHKEYNARADIKERKGPRLRAYNKKYRTENPEKVKEAYNYWRISRPVQAIGKSLRRALERRPTNNPVTLKEAVAMFYAQNGKCALSGIEMTWGKGNYYPTSISIDRIESSKGYTKENIRFLCYSINAMKGVWGDDHVHTMARAIVAKTDADSKEPSWKPYLVHSEVA